MSTSGWHTDFRKALLAWIFLHVLLQQSANATVPAPCASPVLTVAEAAKLLRIDSVEMLQLAEKQELPARRVGATWRFNCFALMAWLNGDWGLIRAAIPPEAANPGSFPEKAIPVAQADLSHVRGAGFASNQPDTNTDAGPSVPVRDDSGPIGEAPEELTAEDVFLSSQRVLLGPGDKSFDYGQFYSESNSELLIFINDRAGLATLEAESLFTTFQGRIGILEETELFVGASYSNSDSAVFLGSEKITSAGRSEFGPLSFGVRRTLKREGSGRPNIIGSLDTLIPAGDSSYAVGGGLAFVKSVDPVALFASINYRHTFSKNFADVSRLEPEDRIDAGLGFALAVNDTLSLNTAVSASFTGATRFPNAELRQQDRYNLQFGLTSWLAEGIYIEPNIRYNLGGPNDNFAFGVRVFTYRR